MMTENLQLYDITEREIEVIGLLAEGLTNNEIATRLSLSKNTIKWYVQQLNQKLFTDGREEIVQEALRLGLLDLPVDSDLSILRTNLLHQTTPFVGRESELSQLQQIIDMPSKRLLTIVAPGGMGKTRLALELAQNQLGAYADGVYFVPLQPIQGKQTIIHMIADSIGFHSREHKKDLKAQLIQFLSKKSILLVLDNFEHVIDGASLVTELLQAAPQICVIVTSREKLNLLGETVFMLSGLRFSEEYKFEDALKLDAVQLIRQAAQRVKPDWDITSANIQSVNRLCKLTEGMPLGILLAISWLDVYSLDRICEEIQANIDILSSEMIDLPPRQRSIRAVFDHTWRRLTQVEQDMLMKISCFRGGFTPDALETMTQASPITLRGLVTKALITRTSSGRYETHELLRQYAEDKLHAVGNADHVRRNHTKYYLNFVSEREKQLKDHRQIDAIQNINADLENINVAWTWAIEHQQKDAIDKSMEALRLFMLLTNRMNRYTTWLDEAINTLSFAEEDDPLFLSLQIYKADALIEQAFTEQSFEIVKALEDDIARIADSQTRALSLVTLSRASYILGDPKASFDYAHSYLEFAQALGDSWHESQAHYAMCLVVGLWDAEKPLYHAERCIELSESTGDRYWLSQGYILGGLMLARLGKIAEAKSYTEKAYDAASVMNDKNSMAAASINLSSFTQAYGNWNSAKILLHRGLILRQDIGYASDSVISIHVRLSELYLLQGDTQTAEDYLTLAEKSLYEVEYPAAISRYYSQKSMMAEYHGMYEDALRFASKATDYIQTNMNWSIVHYVTQRLAWSYCCLDAYDDAQSHLINVTRQELRSNRSWNMIRNVALLSLFVAHSGELERATTMIGLVDQHEIQSAWLQNHPRLATLRHRLREELNDEIYDKAWQRGKDVDVCETLQDWLAELDPDYSDS